MEEMKLKHPLECPLEYKCEYKWENLSPTALDNVRYCETCMTEVHMCKSYEEYSAAVRAKYCVSWKGDVGIPFGGPLRELIPGEYSLIRPNTSYPSPEHSTSSSLCDDDSTICGTEALIPTGASMPVCSEASPAIQQITPIIWRTKDTNIQKNDESMQSMSLDKDCHLLSEPFPDQIPPYLRKTKLTPLEEARWYLDATDQKIAWLAERGLRPHLSIIEKRAQCFELLNANTETTEGDHEISVTLDSSPESPINGLNSVDDSKIPSAKSLEMVRPRSPVKWHFGVPVDLESSDEDEIDF
jgi:hypothetical protein